MRRILIAVLLLCLASCASSAQGLKYHLYAGAGGLWPDGVTNPFPADVEAVGAASVSASPHLSAVGDIAYGFSHSYVRGAGGVRATLSDALNPDFNTYLGVRYRGASISSLGPNEWAPDAGFGWRPNPVAWPHLLLGGDAGYGLTSKQVLLALGVRWEVGPSK